MVASASAYRPDIDALRAIAIVIVVAFHAGVPGFTGGFVGVDVFFVISGFVILRSLIDEQARMGRVSWWAFYGRRIRRLAPAALLMIVVTVLLGMLVLNPIGEQQAVARGGIAAATSTSNFYLALFAGDYFVPTYLPNVFLHTWSLSVEEQFYLGVAALFLVARLVVRRVGWDGRRVMIALILVVCVASLVFAVVLAHTAPTQTFYLPFGRAYELGIGALLAVVNHSAAHALLRRTVWAVSAAVLTCVTVVGLPVFGFPGGWALIPTLATAGMIWAHMTSDDPGGRHLMSAPVLGVGKVSYGWYLWHWPLLSIIATWYLREPPVWIRLVVVLGALAIAALSYEFWELRFRSGVGGKAHRPAGRPTVLAGLTVIAATCVFAFGSVVFADQRGKSHRWTAAWHAKYDTAFPAACTHSVMGTVTTLDGICSLDEHVGSRPSIVVWGDSFAQMLLPGVVKAVNGRPVNVVAMTRGACAPYLPSAAPLPGMSFGLELTRLTLCQQHDDDALRWTLDAAKHQNVAVILAARWPLYRGQDELYSSLDQESRDLMADSGPMVDAGTPALLTRLDRAGVRVDLFGLSPELDRPGPECVVRRWRTFGCDVSRLAEDEYWRATAEWFQRLHATLGDRSRVIDPIDLVCDEQVCRAQQNGVINFSDTDHLSAAAAEMLSNQFSPTVDAVLGPNRTLGAFH